MCRCGVGPIGTLHFGLAATALVAFAVYFAWDIVTLRQALEHPDIYTYYYSYRQWVLGILQKGEYPLWNPYWGLGHPVEVWSSIPIDFYTLLEYFIGPYYHVYMLGQLIVLLLVVWWVSLKLGFDPALAAAGAILFFMSPLVTYWYFSFLITNVYITHVLIFFLMWSWFLTGRRRYVFLLAATVWFSMIGTKIEFWFYETFYFGFLAILLAYIARETTLRSRLRSLTMAWLAIAAGILANAWQLATLLPAVALSGRVPQSGMSVFRDHEFYRNVVLSFSQSGLSQLLGATLLAYLGLRWAQYIRPHWQKRMGWKANLLVLMMVVIGLAAGWRTVSYQRFGDAAPLGKWVQQDDGTQLPQGFALFRRGECTPPMPSADATLRLPFVASGDCFLRTTLAAGRDVSRKLVRIQFELRNLGEGVAPVAIDLQDGKNPVLVRTISTGQQWQKVVLGTFTAPGADALTLTFDVARGSAAPIELRSLSYEWRPSLIPAWLGRVLGEPIEGLQILQHAARSRLWIGLLGALVFALVFGRKEGPIRLFLWIILAIPLVDYFGRPQPGNLGEMDLMARVPRLFPIVVVFFAALGLRSVGRQKLATVAFATIVFIAVMREQGEVVLANLAGVLWIPTRDNYIIDFGLMILALFGAGEVAGAVNSAVGKANLRTAALGPIVTALAIMALIVLPATGRLYNVQALMHEAPPDYPFYQGVPSLKPAFAEMAKTGHARVYIANYDAWGFTHGFGNALLQGVGEITMYDSLTERNYKEWTIYSNLGIRPEQNWDGYVGGYTPHTMATLPRKNTLGQANDTYYHYTVIARPPIRGDLLRLVGVTHLLNIQPITGDTLAEGYDPRELEQSIAALKPVAVEPVDGVAFPGVHAKHYLATLAGALPRAFALTGLDANAEHALLDEMAPAIKDGTIEFAGRRFTVQPEAITRYDREKVRIHTALTEPGVLILSDLYHPFWQARLDGQAVDILPAFRMLRGIRVPPGEHEVEFRYHVPFLTLGAVLSGTTLLLMLAGALIDARRHGF
jgi:hypothetical protein